MVQLSSGRGFRDSETLYYVPQTAGTTPARNLTPQL